MTEKYEISQENEATLLFRFKKPDGSYVSAIDPISGKTTDKVALLTPDETKRMEDMGYQPEPI